MKCSLHSRLAWGVIGLCLFLLCGLLCGLSCGNNDGDSIRDSARSVTSPDWGHGSNDAAPTSVVVPRDEDASAPLADAGVACTDAGGRVASPPPLEQSLCAAPSATSPPRTEASLLGGVRAFGTSRVDQQGPLGLAELLGSDRAVFVDPLESRRMLTLVRLDAAGLHVLDQTIIDGALQLEGNLAAGLDWSQNLDGVLVALDDRRFLLSTAYEGVSLFTIEGERIQSLATLAIADDAVMRAGVVLGNSVWMCGRLLHQVVVGGGDQIHGGAELDLAVAYCRSLALLGDGATLLAGTASGVEVVTGVRASGPSAPRVERTLFAPKAIWRVQRADQRVWVQDYGIPFTPGSVSVYDMSELLSQSDPQPLQVFSPTTLDGAGPWPLGFYAWQSSVVIESVQNSSAEAPLRLELERYDLDDGTYTKMGDSLLLRSGGAYTTTSPFQLHGDGANLIPQPDRRVFPLAGATPVASALEGPLQGAMNRVFGLSDKTALAMSLMHATVVDASDPLHPVAQAKGRDWPVEAPLLQAIVSCEGCDTPGRLVDTFFELTGTPSAADGVACLHAAADGTLSDAGKVRVEPGADFLYGVRGGLYQFWNRGPSTYRARRTPLSPCACSDTGLAFDVDDAMVGGGNGESRERFTWTLAADDDSSEVLLLEGYGETYSAPRTTYVDWFVPEGRALRRAAGLTLPRRLDWAAMSSERALVGTGATLVALRRQGSTLSVEASAEIKGSGGVVPALEHALLWQGDIVYVGLYDSRGPGVLALRFSDLAVLHRYATDERVDSIAVIGTHLAFGMTHGLVLANPVCLAGD